jgi:hypothetical protein
MGSNRVAWLLVAGLALAGSAFAHSGGSFDAPGPLVGVSIEIAGQPAPLYPAPDGSGRYYLEAREGCPYLVRLSNRTAERLGVVLTVDGLNVISGQRDDGRGRMYVLDPWRQATVRGWRSSLQEVRRFTFVDEKASYAARSNKANSRMGWVEVSVYRERRHWRQPYRWDDDAKGSAGRPPGAGERSGHDETAPSAAEPMAEGEARTQGKSSARARSYPGTGWGSRAHDPVVLVDFQPAHSPAQRTTLRYEYRRALVALGVLPSPHVPHDRLWERDRGEPGFAPPPLW